MAFYRQLGNIPPKRHTQHRDESGNLYFEADGRGRFLLGFFVAVPPRDPVGHRRRNGLGTARSEHNPPTIPSNRAI